MSHGVFERFKMQNYLKILIDEINCCKSIHQNMSIITIDIIWFNIKVVVVKIANSGIFLIYMDATNALFCIANQLIRGYPDSRIANRFDIWVSFRSLILGYRIFGCFGLILWSVLGN